MLLSGVIAVCTGGGGGLLLLAHLFFFFILHARELLCVGGRPHAPHLKALPGDDVRLDLHHSVQVQQLPLERALLTKHELSHAAKGVGAQHLSRLWRQR